MGLYTMGLSANPASPAMPAAARPQLDPWPRAYQAVFALVAIVVGGFYLWSVQASNEPFEWRHDKGGYYNMLGRAFAKRHLYLPIQPAPELLALPDPWDPARNAPYSMLDMVLYNRRYYLYHGATPACILFTPYRLLTHRDLPETFVAFLFCFFGYLCSCGALMRLLAATKARPALRYFTLLLLALAICPAVPYLLQRVWVYEVAISGGYFCVSAGFWFLTRGMVPRPAVAPLALAGLMLGLAAGCRPHLAFAGLSAWLALLWYLRRERSLRGAVLSRELLAFTLPIAACALLIAGYNYARFRDPFEFGMRYEMAAAVYFRPAPALRNLVPGLYYLLACPLDFDRVFPFVRLVLRQPFNSPNYQLPARYFLEPIAGVFTTFPAAAVALAAPLIARRWRNASTAIVTALCVFAVAAILFVASLGLVSHRFAVDWLPSFALAACFILGSSSPARSRAGALLSALGVTALIYSVAVNLAIGIQGPYDQVVQAHPAGYVKLALWFSPAARYRLLYNPRLTVEAQYEFPADGARTPLPLVAAGHFGSRYLLNAEMRGGNSLRLTSATSPTAGNTASADVTLIPGAPNRVRLEYVPEDHRILVQWNGAWVLKHDLPFLVTAPTQVTVGEDRSELVPTPEYFPGRVATTAKLINGVDFR